MGKSYIRKIFQSERATSLHTRMHVIEEHEQTVKQGKKNSHPDAENSLALSSYTASAQAENETDVHTDIYGIAATCYTMLTGIVPPNISIRTAHFEQAQTDLLRPANAVVPSIPSHIAQAIHRAMSLQVEECYGYGIWSALLATSNG